jgi:hypothetical protein
MHFHGVSMPREPAIANRPKVLSAYCATRP